MGVSARCGRAVPFEDLSSLPATVGSCRWNGIQSHAPGEQPAASDRNAPAAQDLVELEWHRLRMDADYISGEAAPKQAGEPTRASMICDSPMAEVLIVN